MSLHSVTQSQGISGHQRRSERQHSHSHKVLIKSFILLAPTDSMSNHPCFTLIQPYH